MILIVIIVFRVADYIVHIDPLQVDLRHSDKKPAELICIHNLLVQERYRFFSFGDACFIK